MEGVKQFCKRYWKIILVSIAIAILVDSIGTKYINIGIGNLVIFPMVIATVIGGLLGPEIIKLFKTEECVDAGSLVLVVIAPFMARMGVNAGANLQKLLAVGPALLLQELGNLGTVFLSLPIAILLGLGRQSIGATYSINRDGNLALSNDVWGADAPETYGTFSVYIVGSIIGTVFMSLFASLVCATNWFHPFALGMAAGVGSGSMMTAAAGTVANLYPEFSEEILLYGSTSDVLTGVDGVYLGTFIGIPMTKWLYHKLGPALNRKVYDAEEAAIRAKLEAAKEAEENG